VRRRVVLCVQWMEVLSTGELLALGGGMWYALACYVCVLKLFSGAFAGLR
jgi:hypothetical protein